MAYEEIKNQETNKEEIKKLKKEVSYKRKNCFKDASAEDIQNAFAYAGAYKKYMDAAKTEREAVTESIAMAQAKGYVPYSFGDKLEPGKGYYYNNRGKSLYLFRIGTNPVGKGVAISAAHVDSPRIDLKQNPLYEDNGIGYFKTHYYGGIKKYQWTTIPLALHGVVTKADGKTVTVTIGEDENDPLFYITDLLPHLAAGQMSQKLSDAIAGESLNVVLGTQPYPGDEESDAVKFHMMSLLNEKYGMTEVDFQSAELTVVPAYKARDIGLDRSLIAAYGHDDRVCAYTALTALLDTEASERTVMVILADKEETGSDGNTGMQTMLFLDLLDEIAIATGDNPRALRAASECLSADVNAAFDPNFGEVYEKKNCCYLNGGVCLTKFTGARGKSGTSDASAEFVGRVRKLFEDNGVIWQTGELGKVDCGGGGTVAKYIANYNIDTVDIGVPVISMHAPYEVISKMDLYMTYRAFVAFHK